MWTAGYHLLTHKLGGEPVWQHHCVVSGWNERIHIPHQTEPKERYLNKEDRAVIRAGALIYKCLFGCHITDYG